SPIRYKPVLNWISARDEQDSLHPTQRLYASWFILSEMKPTGLTWSASILIPDIPMGQDQSRRSWKFTKILSHRSTALKKHYLMIGTLLRSASAIPPAARWQLILRESMPSVRAILSFTT